MLVCAEHSKITGVSVYPKRAEVTRLFKFQIKTGQNQVVINGLPVTLDWDSLWLVVLSFAAARNIGLITLFEKSRRQRSRYDPGCSDLPHS